MSSSGSPRPGLENLSEEQANPLSSIQGGRGRMTVDDTFLSRVGHDLRGELATMVTGVHYVLRYEPSLGEASRQMLTRVQGAGQRLRRLLDELDDAVWI